MFATPQAGSWRLPVQKAIPTLGPHDEPHDFQEGVSLCCCPNFPLPARLVRGPELCPCWQLTNEALLPARQTPTTAPGLSCLARAGGWSSWPVCGLAAAGCPGARGLIPQGEQAGIPLLLLGTNRFPELVQALKAQEWDIDLCHLAPCPP